jgi:hypothetical protein
VRAARRDCEQVIVVAKRFELCGGELPGGDAPSGAHAAPYVSTVSAWKPSGKRQTYGRNGK